MTKTKVLIFPAGAENAINIYDSLKYNLHFELYGASTKSDHGVYLYDSDHYEIGDFSISDVHFLDNFNSFLDRKKIDYIIPTHDTIALYLMRHEKEIHATIVCSPLATTEVAHSKKKTYEILKNKSYCPKIYGNVEDILYPVFLKPDVGSGGKGTAIIENENELKKFVQNNIDSFVISEVLPGSEFTVDCFTDKNGKLLFVGPRTRERITVGVSFRSKTILLTEEIKTIAEDLNHTFTFRGAWFFQVKEDSNKNLKLMEICVREAGTMALYRQLGVNFASLSLFDFMGLPVQILYHSYPLTLDRMFFSSYKLEYEYDDVYVDFDDTLIVNDKVNTLLISFLYQVLNEGKNLYLITKHATDIFDDLKKYRIDSSIFTKVIHLKDQEHKCDFITSSKGILIDNYFPERKEVFEKCKIMVFDVDSVSCLMKNI